jgi:hypothetical protein
LIGAASYGVTFADGTTFRIQDAFDAGAAQTLTGGGPGNVTVSTTSNFGWQGAGGFTKVDAAMLTQTGTNDYVGNTVLHRSKATRSSSLKLEFDTSCASNTLTPYSGVCGRT